MPSVAMSCHCKVQGSGKGGGGAHSCPYHDAGETGRAPDSPYGWPQANSVSADAVGLNTLGGLGTIQLQLLLTPF